MKKQNKILLTIATVLLFGVFVFPIWQIRLRAPQYPEGLGLNINIHSIESMHPHNISTINDLNHYIGMKAINPDSVPALKIMPYAAIFLIVLGLITVIIHNRVFLISWLVVFIGMAIAGFADFYKWEYDYGHHLDPHAAIKIPGMSFSPPLFGGKQLLNIHATSIPGIGGILLFISLLVGIYVVINEFRSRKIAKAGQKA